MSRSMRSVLLLRSIVSDLVTTLISLLSLGLDPKVGNDMRPGTCRLEGRRGAQQICLAVGSRNHLQAHGQAVAGEPAGNRGRGVPGQVERVGVIDPGDDAAVGQLRWDVDPGPEGR